MLVLYDVIELGIVGGVPPIDFNTVPRRKTQGSVDACASVHVLRQLNVNLAHSASIYVPFKDNCRRREAGETAGHAAVEVAICGRGKRRWIEHCQARETRLTQVSQDLVHELSRFLGQGHFVRVTGVSDLDGGHALNHDAITVPRIASDTMSSSRVKPCVAPLYFGPFGCDSFSSSIPSGYGPPTARRLTGIAKRSPPEPA